MEFSSFGLGAPPQQTSAAVPTSGSAGSTSANLQSNPATVVTSAGPGDESRSERDSGTAAQGGSSKGVRDGETGSLTGRRTTLNFDAEQNRIFLEIVDTSTNEVVERIPSEFLAQLISQTLDAERDIASGRDEPVVDRSI